MPGMARYGNDVPSRVPSSSPPPSCPDLFRASTSGRRLVPSRRAPRCRETWMAGTSPAMTAGGDDGEGGRPSIRRFAPTPERGPGRARDEGEFWAAQNPSLTLSSGEAAYRRAGPTRIADPPSPGPSRKREGRRRGRSGAAAPPLPHGERAGVRAEEPDTRRLPPERVPIPGQDTVTSAKEKGRRRCRRPRFFSYRKYGSIRVPRQPVRS